MSEAQKYEQLDVSDYYQTDHTLGQFWPIFKHVPDRHKVRALFAGCGRGEVLRIFQNSLGVDFNSALEPLWAELRVSKQCSVQDCRELPFSDNDFEYTFSVDFLEHLPREHVESVLKELYRVAPKGVHVIDLIEETNYRDAQGNSLHTGLTMKDWQEVLNDVVGPVTMQVLGQGQHIMVNWG